MNTEAFLRGYMDKEALDGALIGMGAGGAAGLLAAHLYNRIKKQRGWKPYLYGGLTGAGLGGLTGAYLEEEAKPEPAIASRAGELPTKTKVFDEPEKETTTPAAPKAPEQIVPKETEPEGKSKYDFPWEPKPEPKSESVKKVPASAPAIASRAGELKDWPSLIKKVTGAETDPTYGSEVFEQAVASTGASIKDVKATAEREAALEQKFFDYMRENQDQAADFLAWYRQLPKDRKGRTKNPFGRFTVNRAFFAKVDARLKKLLGGA